MKSLRSLYKIGYGPSSSHTMGPYLASKKFLESYNDATSYKVILYGSLALTGKGHLSDKVIYRAFENKNISVEFNIDKKDLKHPNTMQLIAYYSDKTISKWAYSIGGGSVKFEDEELLNEVDVYPHNSFKDIKDFINKKNISLINYVEFCEGNEIRNYLQTIYNQMVDTIHNGLEKEGLLPGDLKVIRKAKEIYESKITEDSLNYTKDLYAYAFASSEENASGNIVVTAPTCGSCGVLPAVLLHTQLQLGLNDDKIVDALMVAGLIGNLVKQNASISGAEAGCQAEIGTACAMASAAYAYLLGASIEQIEQAAEIALEHHLGLTCDPIGGFVQIPCIERNAVCALRAIDAAKLVIFIKPSTSKISFDMVVKTMLETGKDLNTNYKETSIGGLAKEYKK